MVDRAASSPSRIPIPRKSPIVKQKNGAVQKDGNGSDLINASPNASFENGIVGSESYGSCGSTGNSATMVNDNEVKSQPEAKGFETFLMTGDMMIRTTSAPKSRNASTRNPSDSTDTSDTNMDDHSSSYPSSPSIAVGEKSHDREFSDSVPMMKSNQMSSESGFEDQGQMSDTGTLERDKQKDRLNDPSSISDLSMTSSEDVSEMIKSQSSAVSSTSTASDMRSDISEQTVIHQNIGSECSTDSSSGVISPEVSNGDLTCTVEEKEVTDVSNQKTKIVTSKSAEKIILTKASASSHQTVRSSKSQELQVGAEFSMVNIDIDDNYAYSLDQIPQQGTNDSPDSLNEQIAASKSLDSSPEHSKTERVNDKEFIPGFISFDDSHSRKLKTKEQYENGAYMTNNDVNDIDEKTEFASVEPSSAKTFHTRKPEYYDREIPLPQASPEADTEIVHRSDRDSFDPSVDPNLLDYQPPIKSVDQPSAFRLAKRLYNLEGFKKSDVARHLYKKNDFNSIVAEEYLRFFDFVGDTLDLALRKFLKQFSLLGETQERERVLAYFSSRFLFCNPGSFNSEDACHTLTCAIMLLNTDLHGPTVGRRMTCAEFIENLAELNDGENFPKDVLKCIYQAIKSEPLEWAVDDSEDEQTSTDDRTPQSPPPVPQPMIASHNPFLDVPDPSKTTEYKSGYVMRKCCMEPDNRKTPIGKRGWKMFYATLCDMMLYLYKDQHSMKKGHLAESGQNAIRIHHCLATKASDYKKKQHVFRLQTADWAEYLFQTSDSKELQEWIDTVNYVAATLSAPALPGGVGSQKNFQRPLLPASYTRFTLKEQLQKHEDRSNELHSDLHSHRQHAPEKGSKARIIQNYIEKESFLEYELKRYKTYIYLMQAHLAAHPELEPSLVETVIGEVEEPEGERRAPPTPTRGVQRSLSDRYSYRAAIYQNERMEYDIL
ncbi:hypothetical protein FSP39_000202 [Pinctada imbricata]|uniref:PH and SEC7 domain-containing protein 3 n=1 Tax=Pinctada imbricata TaxID=66713 RepID=A0AA88XP29_PINIB|nr:hypothetical protein FSP39_000202 [Pinctada imbricata]